jgi:hypothetical protein
MRPLACLFLLAACVCPAPANGGSFVRAPIEDVGIPFWCDWGYGWDERCYRDDTAPNRGVRLKLAEGEEDFGVSGPYFPSASFRTAALLPRLVVSYVVPTSGLSLYVVPTNGLSP